MIILELKNINLSFGVEPILEKVSFSVKAGEKACIIGVNGSGKSTLLKLIKGLLHPDEGEIFYSRGVKIGYLEQNTGLDSQKTIREEILSVFSELISMEKRIKEIESLLGKTTEEDKQNSLLKEYAQLTENFENRGGYGYNGRVTGILKGLGFNELQFDLMVSSLSGGQKTRLALAKQLLEEPDVLLLDEPTNHLDIEALEWFEEFLHDYRKSVVIVSHDRYFLDKVADKTIELENRQVKSYNGNYSQYMKLKEAEREIQKKHYELQQKEIARMEAFIEQQRQWNREKNIIAAESRQKAIDRMEKIEKPKALPSKIKIKFKNSISSGNDVLEVNGLSKEYPGKKLFENVSFEIKRNEKVFLLGPNGSGKSTILKIISGRLQDYKGCYGYGHNVALGYYDQELADLNPDNTVIEEVWSSDEKILQTDVRNLLALFLFQGEDVFKKVGILSGGEKSRVALVKLILSGANLLLLDEPTNHLDINSREALEESLLNFEGTIFAISHDRYFIKKLASRILELGKYSVFDFKGDYQFYLDRRKDIKIADNEDTEKNNISASKMERLEQKEQKARQRKLEKEISQAEKEIESIESRLREIEGLMVSPEISTDHLMLTELHQEETVLKLRLEELYALWEELAEINMA